MLYRVSVLVLRPLARVLFRPTVEGRENVPLHGPLILASNHLSFIDSIIIPLMAPRPVGYLAKGEYFTGTGLKGWFVRSLFTALGAIPVERDTARAAQASLDAALRVLRADGAFGIYPEGTRSRDGRLYRGKTGVAWLAMTANVPVLPVGVIGTNRVQPVGARVPRPYRITVRFGRPITVPVDESAKPAQVRRIMTDEVMAAIHELSEQELAGAYNEHPPTA